MDKIIRYFSTLYYWGRNGRGKQTGLNVSLYRGWEGPDYIQFNPRNTRGASDAAILRIPIDRVDDLIRALKEIQEYDKDGKA